MAKGTKAKVNPNWDYVPVEVHVLNKDTGKMEYKIVNVTAQVFRICKAVEAVADHTFGTWVRNRLLGNYEYKGWE